MEWKELKIKLRISPATTKNVSLHLLPLKTQNHTATLYIEKSNTDVRNLIVGLFSTLCLILRYTIQLIILLPRSNMTRTTRRPSLHRNLTRNLIKVVNEEWGFDLTRMTTSNSAIVACIEFLLALAIVFGKVQGEKGLVKIETPFDKTEIAAHTLSAITPPYMMLYAFLGKEIMGIMHPGEISHLCKNWIENYSSEMIFEASALLVDCSAVLADIAIITAPKLDQGGQEVALSWKASVGLRNIWNCLSKQRLIPFCDFDLACTVVDCSAILADVAIITAPKLDQGGQEVALSWKASVDLRNNWNCLSKQYTEEYKQCIEIMLPSAKAEEFNFGSLYEAIEQLSDVQKHANVRVIESEVLTGINMEDIKWSGERIMLLDGCIGFFQKIVKNEKVTAGGVHVLSYCWCGDLIKSGFSSGGLSVLDIRSDDFGFEKSISTGEILWKVESPMDKLQALKEIQKCQNDAQNHLSVYIGDSVGDLLCLLEMDIGIVIGSSASLRKAGNQYGVSFVLLFSGLVKKQRVFSRRSFMLEGAAWYSLHGFWLD